MGIEASKEEFLKHLEVTGSVTKAAKLAGARPQTLYVEKVKDHAFDHAWEMALIRFFGTADPDKRDQARKPARRGRPGNYDPLSHPDSARKLKALGLRNEHIALAFGIAKSVFEDWIKKYPELAEALDKGLDDLSKKTALHSLYTLMNGYEHPEEKHFYNAALDKVVTVKTTKHYPPNVAAIIFWLCNKLPDQFQSVNKQRIDMNTDGLKELAEVLRQGPVPRAKSGSGEAPWSS